MNQLTPVLPHIISTLCRAAAAIIILCAVAAARADAVTDWNATVEQALRNPTPAPAVQNRTASIVHAAIFDAVNGITCKYTPVRVTDFAPPGAHAEAAAVQAAHTALSGLFPTKQALFDAQLAASLAKIPGADSSQPVAVGRAWGESVAKKILEWRANDGFSQTLTYQGSTAAGYWRHAPLGSAPAVGISTSVTVPFALANTDAFDPGPPYGIADRAAAMKTTAYATDVNDVRVRGGATSTVRTQAQAALAQFINVADVSDVNAIVRRAVPANARLVDNARTFVLLNFAGFDASTVVLKAKYKYGLWRPLQAIPFAAESGNPAITADPNWTPLGATPSHPEYLSGHAGVTGAMLAMASALLGDDTTFTLTTSNPGAPAITPTFRSFSAYSDAIGEARVDIGFHFKSCCQLSQRIGYAIANTLLATALTPVEPSQFANLSLRGNAGSGNETLITGFTIDGPARQVLIRGVGPRLAVFGFTGALSDPRIVLYDGAGRIVAENDNWSATGDADAALIADAATRVSAFPLVSGSRDAALLKTLAPGVYTVHVSGVGGVSGISLLEIYHVP
jgi:hypothetical protein